MNATRSKKVRHAMSMIARHHGDRVQSAAEHKLAMSNRFGKPQHRTINPKRQLKKMIVREKIS